MQQNRIDSETSSAGLDANCLSLWASPRASQWSEGVQSCPVETLGLNNSTLAELGRILGPSRLSASLALPAHKSVFHGNEATTCFERVALRASVFKLETEEAFKTSRSGGRGSVLLAAGLIYGSN